MGTVQEKADSLVGLLRDTVTAPIRNWRSLSQPTSAQSKRSSVEFHWALRDISFEVNAGEVLGVIGRNGAGKSTLLKILSRITEPTSGVARIRGRVSSLLEVGTGFHPELSGRENVYLNGTILGMTKYEIDRRFDEIVDFSGVEKFLDTPVKRYSSGMKVRLAFSVASSLEPEILIVDEVLAVGDSEFQKKCIGKMQDVARGGRTVLFVSHSMTAVRRLCTHAIVLTGGLSSPTMEVEDAIANYSVERPCLERVWENNESAPGDEFVRLLSVRAIPGKPPENGLVWIEHPLSIEMEYEVSKTGSAPTPNLHFFLTDGSHVFVSHDTEVRWHSVEKNPGRYTSVCELPPFFFNTGTIILGAALTTYHPFQVHCFAQDALQLCFHETEEASIFRAGFAGPIPGAIRPVFRWNTQTKNFPT